MVQAIIDIDERTNRVLNILKAKYGLKDKSAAIVTMATQYEQQILEPELRPEFVEKASRAMKEKAVPIGTLEDFGKRYGVPAGDTAKRR